MRVEFDRGDGRGFTEEPLRHGEWPRAMRTTRRLTAADFNGAGPSTGNTQRKHAMNLIPLNDNVIIRQIKPETVRASGLVLSDRGAAQVAGRELVRGEVLAVGPGKWVEPEYSKRSLPMVATGDIVVFGEHVGTKIKCDGEDLLVVSAPDIVAVEI